MKKYFAIIFSAVLLMSCSDKNEPASSGSGNSSSSGMEALTSENHPRVIFTDDDFAEMQSLYESGENRYFNEMYDSIKQQADGYVGAADLQHTLVGIRMLSVCYTAEQRILTCAFMYKVTGIIGKTKCTQITKRNVQFSTFLRMA